ncbi:metallophosphoesterase [Hymenobacter guriensis]|uniref:Metallophosphoesterase n=1 Tax=Hymenobacter guriensis TaxID=2793065 RepID=A0ABS0KX07_9BACT|nr:metallophosphoesterase [Hymenobacter guriensis]MBG8552400.1 metallophosphoesterase [Hymenobacter guriensis]
MLKKILLGTLLLYVVYVLGGIGLIATGAIDKLYFLPGWSVKGPKSDKSGFAADGPLVFYQDSLLISSRIAPRGGSLVLLTDTLRPGAATLVTCFADETSQEFQVPLRSENQVPADTYAEPEKLLAVSDIEGNFKGFQALLRGAGVVNDKLNWQFGRGHLVLVGDFFDRGLNVTECLWLIYKLEQEAEQAGGKVHFILGNHERMNMTEHFKYVRRKYRVNADTLGVPYNQWYTRSTVLGRWLRTKNVVEKIGTTLFVHGGIGPEVVMQKLPLTKLNDLARISLDKPVAALTALEKQVTQPPSSPDWYRGLAQQEASAAHVAQLMQLYTASRVVIGHTPVEHISTLYDGKVVAIDLPHQEHTAAGRPVQALWLEKGQLTIIDSQGQKSPLK